MDGRKLISLAANVLFLTENIGEDIVYHPRFNIQKHLPINIFLIGKRMHCMNCISIISSEDKMDFGMKSHGKLPMLLSATDMLICGEDLGLVPDCVPGVMDALGITALKVQRSPKEDVPYYNPQNAGYMNVVTASSHDSSTLRQWWKEKTENLRRIIIIISLINTELHLRNFFQNWQRLL